MHYFKNYRTVVVWNLLTGEIFNKFHEKYSIESSALINDS